MSYSDKKVFLTGANGFVASQILSDLIKVFTLCSLTLFKMDFSQGNADCRCLTVRVSGNREREIGGQSSRSPERSPRVGRQSHVCIRTGHCYTRCIRWRIQTGGGWL